MTNSKLTLSKRYSVPAIFSALFLLGCSSGQQSSEEQISTNINTTTVADDGEQGSNSDTDTTPEVTTPDTANLGTANLGTAALDMTALYPPGPLPPFANPPLSAAPTADDQPLIEPSQFNAAEGFTLLREPGERLPEDIEASLTDADFLAGPLPATYEVPESVDTSSNTPPYFDNLTDQQLLAGEILEVLYKPLDADGMIPGMYPERLPEGSSFIDNFDGTKTFRWQPLQMDVGIREFTVIALDPENSLYRTRRTIRIKIELPDDPSDIPNVAPRLEEQFSFVARVNDPTIIELKGIDLNGPAPIIEIQDLPTAASLTQHLRFEEIYVLKFTPTTEGIHRFEVTLRDAVDSSLTSTESINLDVRAAEEFVRPGGRLRELAAQRSINFGFAARHEFYHRPDSGLYTSIAAQEFDIVTPENALKMDYINPLAGRYQFAETDNLVAYAQRNNMRVHGHPLVWHRQLPQWIEESSVEDRAHHMREYIDRILSRYRDSIEVWDVVNEPLEEDGSFRNSVWFEAMGEDYIDLAFRQAAESAPNTIKLLNDFDIAQISAKSTAMIALLDTLIEKNTPVDGVGFQMHIWTDFDHFDDIAENFQAVADRDLDIYITELDVSLAGDDDVEKQASVYEAILTLCLAQPRCKSLQTWGFTDQYSWRRNHQPLLFDTAYQAKPSYFSLQEKLTLQ